MGKSTKQTQKNPNHPTKNPPQTNKSLPSKTPKTHTSKREKAQAEACTAFYLCWIYANPNPWARQWTVCMWMLLGKQDGNHKQKQLFLNYFQQRQTINFKHQTTHPMHRNHSGRSISSSLLTAFPAAGMAPAWLGSWWCSSSLGESSDVSKPSPSGTWSPAHTLSFKSIPRASAMPAPGHTTQNRDTERGRPLQSPAMAIMHIKPGLCNLCKM